MRRVARCHVVSPAVAREFEYEFGTQAGLESWLKTIAEFGPNRAGRGLRQIGRQVTHSALDRLQPIHAVRQIIGIG